MGMTMMMIMTGWCGRPLLTMAVRSPLQLYPGRVVMAAPSSRSLTTAWASGVRMRPATTRLSAMARAGSRRTFFQSARSRQQQQQQQQDRSSNHHQHHHHHSTARDAGLAWTSVLSDPQEVAGPEGLPSRAQQVQRLQDEHHEYDVVVVGGGATGAGVALEAASRGLSVACLERGDFASETSSRSTKLIWAGIKYMGTAMAALLSRQLFTDPVTTASKFWAEMTMVRHCHIERDYMTRRQPHLCQWLPLVVPFTQWHLRPPPLGHDLYGFFPILAPLVFKFYDGLSGFSCPPSYLLTPRRAHQLFPQLKKQFQDAAPADGPPPAQKKSSFLKYCAVFYEAVHNDARTNLAVALTAIQYGAHVANYVEVIDLVKEEESSAKVVGVRVLDRMTGRTWTIRAKKVILAGGPFTDTLRQYDEGQDFRPAVAGAWGTHIVLPGYYLPPNMGLLDYQTSDGRFMFIIPWQGHTLVGTTDKKGPAETLPTPPEEDIQWLLQEARRYLSPDLAFRRSDVLSAWRGWRPLAADPHAAPDGPVSRDHVISENPATGVVFIAGGKWTTWRQMAQEVVDRVVGPQGPPSVSLGITLYGGAGFSNHLALQLIQQYGLEREVAEHLAQTYGGRAWEVCALCEPSGQSWPRFGRRLVEHYPYLEAEVVFACREYACTVEDVLSRRTRLAVLNKEAALQAIPRVAAIMARELGWTDRVLKQQIEAARQYVGTYGGPVPTGIRQAWKQQSFASPAALFQVLDRDENGVLDATDLSESLSILTGSVPAAAEVQRTLSEMGGKKGRVTSAEFCQWWTQSKGHALRKQLQRELQVGELSVAAA